MTAKLYTITTDAGAQRALLTSFKVSAATLNIEELQNILQADHYRQFDLLSDLARKISDKVECPPELKSQFRHAATAALVTMMPSLEYTDHDDLKSMQDVIELAQFDILAKYREIAVQHGLLAIMFESGRQHASHAVDLNSSHTASLSR